MRRWLLRYLLRTLGAREYLRVLLDDQLRYESLRLRKLGQLFTVKPCADDPILPIGGHLLEVEGITLRMRQARDVSEAPAVEIDRVIKLWEK